jgi:sulfur-oxidizing protein SoxX
MRTLTRLVILLSAFPLASAAVAQTHKTDRNAEALAALKASFKPHGQAGMDRLDQDKTQALCSAYAPHAPPAKAAAQLQTANRDSVKYPADG